MREGESLILDSLVAQSYKLCMLILTINLSSPRNALQRGYSNASVVPCIRLSIRVFVPLGPCEDDRD